MNRINPILPGFNPDPSITRVGNDYFLATSSFEYWPGVPIYHSKDLAKWTLIGHALTRPSQLHIASPEPGGGVWAPTLRYHNNKFYLATSSFDRFRPQEGDRLFPRGFYVSTSNIWDSTSWSDPIYFDVTGFDQDLFWDDDGSVYLSTTHVKADRPCDVNRKQLDYAIHICQVDLETGDSITKSEKVRESSSGIAEGSHVFRRGRYYYLLTAEGGTGCKHSALIFRSEHGVFGPWSPCPSNPLLKSSVNNHVQNTGHVDFVEGEGGKWWAVFLGVRPLQDSAGTWKDSVFGRETFLVEVQWIDDWPVLQDLFEIDKAHEPQSQTGLLWRDDFSQDSLQLGWYRKNSSLKSDHSIMKTPNRLRLHGGPYNLSTSASPTMFLRKQLYRQCVWRTRLSFHPRAEREEAGTVIWWNYLTYSTIGIRKAPEAANQDTPAGARVIRFTSAEGTMVEHALCQLNSDVELFIKCDASSYDLGFTEVDAETESSMKAQPQWIGRVETEVMTTPPRHGLAFSGMMLGLYAFAQNCRCSAPADFHYTELKTECT